MSARSSTTRRSNAISRYCTEMENKGRLIAKLDAPSQGSFRRAACFSRLGHRRDGARDVRPGAACRDLRGRRDRRGHRGYQRKGYGLTFGLHTRIEARVQHFVDGIHAGNIYVNRNQIGAVVGSQPFGGEGLSGTGPKAGGPHYLRRFRKGRAMAGQAAADGHKVPATELADHLPDPTLDGWSTRPDRLASAEKASARQGRRGHVGIGGYRFRPGRPAGADRRSQYAVACAARPRAVPRCRMRMRLLAQAIQALAAGNAVLAVAPRRAGGAVTADRQGPAASQPSTAWSTPAICVRSASMSSRSPLMLTALRVVRRALAAASGPDRAAGVGSDQSRCLCA